MPLLNDAKTCYVGTQPITKIMAGAVKVWPKGPAPPDRLSLHKYDPEGMCIVFNSFMKREFGTCSYIQDKFRWRYKRTSDSSFSQWYNFDQNNSFIKGTDMSPDVEWTYILRVLTGSTPSQAYQDAIFEVWKTTDEGENAWTDSIVMDLNIPSETLPDVDYTCDSNVIP